MRKMSYTKKPGLRSLNETPFADESLSEEVNFENDELQPLMDGEALEGYQKGDSTIQPKLYVLLVEGDSKEPDYFDMLCESNAYNNLCVFYKPFANDTQYKGNLAHKMASAANDAIQEGKIVINGEEITITDIDDIYIVWMSIACTMK